MISVYSYELMRGRRKDTELQLVYHRHPGRRESFGLIAEGCQTFLVAVPNRTFLRNRRRGLPRLHRST